MRRIPTPLHALALLACLLLASSPRAHAGAATPRRASVTPGTAGRGRVRLPNGWYLSPAGTQVAVGDFPLGLAVSPDGRWAASTHSGWHGKGFDLVDLARGVNVQHVALPETFVGVDFFAGGTRLAVSEGHQNRVLLYRIEIAALAGGQARLQDSIAVGEPWSAGGAYPQGRPADYGPGAIWTTGLCADDARRRLYVVSRLDSAVHVVDLAAGRAIARIPLGAVPWNCRLSRDGARLFVSLWSDSAVAVIDIARRQVTQRIAAGPHPTDLAESPDGARLFVADANANTVAAIDLGAGRVSEWLRTSRDARVPMGDTPNGLALDARGERLYVADAGGDHLAVFDVRRAGHARAIGFLPVGWYPSAVRLVPGQQRLVVANAKGAGSSPSKGVDTDTSAWCRYVSYSPSARGTLSIVDAPDSAGLARATAQVLANTPAVRPRPAKRPPIGHVFYIIKENRSYDQVLGDLRSGDGDSSLCLFGAAVTPNHHALAREFVTLDRTFCDSDGSADGHNWGMAAYATDYVIKGEPNNRIYDFEGGNPLAYPQGGYLWDLCARHGVSYRSYGEFVFNGETPQDTVRAGAPGLAGHVAPHYLGYDLNVSDLDREQAWRAEFDRYDRDGGLPQLSIIRLPNDHTEGTCSGRPTPRAHVAENDLALGRMIERISHSRYWRDALVLVIEDDAANGQDHVDGHRTVALMAGPYVKRGVADHTLYTNCSVLRCIEDVLGMPPMSTFDARANGLEGSLRATPDFTPYVHREAGIDLGERNLAGAFGQAQSDAMDFRVADAVPNDVLNGILWRSVHGRLPAPAPVRSAQVLRARRSAGAPGADTDD